jgi:hypothetical protein
MKEEQPMRTSILALVIAAITPVMAQAQSPSWLTDYAAAQRKATTQQLPLAVVFGQGSNGMEQLGGGSLTPDANRLLADRYVACYVDTTTPEGEQLCQAFRMNGKVGVVISDRTGKLQAFFHEGPLSADRLNTYLTRYADPQRVVVTTETNPQQGFSNYPPSGPVDGHGYASYYPPAGGAHYSSCSSGGCSTGGQCHSRRGGGCGRSRSGCGRGCR